MKADTPDATTGEASQTNDRQALERFESPGDRPFEPETVEMHRCDDVDENGFSDHQPIPEEAAPERVGNGSEYPPDEMATPSTPVVDHHADASPEPGEPTVVFTGVGLCFKRSARTFLSFNKNRRKNKNFWALQEVSFTVHEGETLGVIGRNGSGKSTLSMLCSGVLLPDRGKVAIHGQTQLLALGVGFKVELSGRENVFISASLLGLSKKEITSKMEDIEAFAELGDYMDEPVRTYSSGMRSRLGFAVATAVKPDILILDEIMATGDKAFREKAMERMNEMRQLARSIIIVSHNPGQLKKLSTKVLWLEKGRVMMLDDPEFVLSAYNQFCKHPDKWLANHRQPDRGEGRTVSN